ncbi:MAG: DUF192 domain-containing protein [Candidatus Paceibacterota bacterium]
MGILIFLSLRRPGRDIPVSRSEINVVEIGGKAVKVELALSDTEKAKGLSGRPSLKEEEGMLFVFENTTRHPFWMKDMLIPIDMIWIDEVGVVVYIAHEAQPNSYPALFGSNVESKYVLEVTAGFAKRHKVVIGSKVNFR